MHDVKVALSRRRARWPVSRDPTQIEHGVIGGLLIGPDMDSVAMDVAAGRPPRSADTALSVCQKLTPHPQGHLETTARNQSSYQLCFALRSR